MAAKAAVAKAAAAKAAAAKAAAEKAAAPGTAQRKRSRPEEGKVGEAAQEKGAGRDGRIVF